MDNATTVIPQIGRLEYTTVEWYIHRITQYVYGLLLVFSVFTNTIVVYVFLSKKFGKRTIVKYLYVNISLSDLMILVACVVEVMIIDSNGEKSCTADCRKNLGLVITTSGYVSAYTMALIAFKRYYGIAYPVEHWSQNANKTSHRKWLLIIILVWIFSITMTLLFMKYEEIPVRHETMLLHQCTLLKYSLVAMKTYPYANLIGLVIIPLVFGMFFSLKAIYFLQKKTLVGEQADSENIKREKNLKLKSTFMIVVVLISFVLSWLPIIVLNMMDSQDDLKMELCDLNYNAHAITCLLLMLDIFINPLIYCYMSPDFRRGVTHIFINKCDRKSQNA